MSANPQYDGKPSPIQLGNQGQLLQANTAMRERIDHLKEQIAQLIVDRIGCDTITNLKAELADAEAAADHIRRAF